MRRHILLWAIASLGLMGCSREAGLSKVEAYPGYTGVYDGFTLIIDDPFDAFNEAIWKAGDGAVGEEALCRFTNQGVKVEDGVLRLVVTPEYVPESFSEDHQLMKDDYDYSCGELRTLPEIGIRYGRIEARMKAPARQTASGYISSLFTYTNNKGRDPDNPDGLEWEEIDVELEGGRPDKFQANLIYGKDVWEWWRTREFGAWEDKIETGPVDEWRVFAIEWLPDQIRWYVDGELVKTLTAEDIDCDPECIAPQVKPTQIPDGETTVFMNFWIPNDIIQDDFGGNKERNAYPMTAEYDWFRYYQLDTHPVGFER